MSTNVAAHGSVDHGSFEPAASASEHELRTTIEQLQLENAELQRKKLEAENDRELFRELYGKASARVGEVAKENSELSERLVLLEGQLGDGLAMLRNTYGERVRKLQVEVDRWRDLCAVLTERDKWTDDEVRRRAALEPELREQNRVLTEELEKLGRDYGNAQQLLGQMTEQDQKDLETFGSGDHLSAVSTPVPA